MLSTGEVHWDAVFRALASQQRRAVLQALYDATGELTVTELAGRLSADGEPRAAIITDLHHQTLPLLARAGLIDCASQAGTVSLTTLAYRLPIGTITPQLVPEAGAPQAQQADD